MTSHVNKLTISDTEKTITISINKTPSNRKYHD